MDGEAGWWTTSGNIGLPPLARAMGVGRQQHNTDDELDLLGNMHNIQVPREPKQSLRVGDSARIAMTRKPFKKTYTCQWSEELFVVSEKLRTIPTTYRVRDLVDEQIGGIFYHQELQLLRVKQDKVYTVERILKKKNRAKKIEYFVKWNGMETSSTRGS